MSWRSINILNISLPQCAACRNCIYVEIRLLRFSPITVHAVTMASKKNSIFSHINVKSGYFCCTNKTSKIFLKILTL